MWALPLLALGLGLVACGVLIPEADANRRLADERRALAAELAALQGQADRNDEFLGRLHSDPQLVARLVRRQEPPALPGAEVAAVTATAGGRFAASPYALLAAEPTAAPTPTTPRGGGLAELCRDRRLRLAVLGAGLMCCMIGLLSGGSRRVEA